MNPRGPAFLLVGFFGMHLFNRFLSAFVCERDPERKDYAIGLLPMLGIGFHSFIDGFIYSIAFTVSVLTGFLATVGMVLLILFVVYRNIVTILVPLATITVSQAAATQGVAALATWGLPISQQTVVFMSAMMIGAGVDYAVFLISRYHEYLRQGLDSDDAVARALTAIGKVIAASAATVAVTFLGMSFTSLKVFSTTGPALAVTIAVAFLSSITLLPAILTLVGRRGWARPRKELTSRFWHRSGINIVGARWSIWSAAWSC